VQEAKKVLFYYPTDVELDTKIRQVGLCEAVTKFTRYVVYFLVMWKLSYFVFYSAHNARIASAVLDTAIPSVRPSVSPSVCPSVRHTPVLCQNGDT